MMDMLYIYQQVKNNNKQHGRYGLPLEVKYCVKCNVSNQKPTSTNEYKHDKNTAQITIEFDSNNICYACTSNKKNGMDK